MGNVSVTLRAKFDVPENVCFFVCSYEVTCFPYPYIRDKSYIATCLDCMFEVVLGCSVRKQKSARGRRLRQLHPGNGHHYDGFPPSRVRDPWRTLYLLCEPYHGSMLRCPDHVPALWWYGSPRGVVELKVHKNTVHVAPLCPRG